MKRIMLFSFCFLTSITLVLAGFTDSVVVVNIIGLIAAFSYVLDMPKVKGRQV